MAIPPVGLALHWGFTKWRELRFKRSWLKWKGACGGNGLHGADSRTADALRCPNLSRCRNRCRPARLAADRCSVPRNSRRRTRNTSGTPGTNPRSTPGRGPAWRASPDHAVPPGVPARALDLPTSRVIIRALWTGCSAPVGKSRARAAPPAVLHFQRQRLAGMAAESAKDANRQGPVGTCHSGTDGADQRVRGAGRGAPPRNPSRPARSPSRVARNQLPRGQAGGRWRCLRWSGASNGTALPATG